MMDSTAPSKTLASQAVSSALAVMAAFASSGASAQQAARAPEDVQIAQAAAAPAPGASASAPAAATAQLDNVVVTARKRVERAQDVPVSVTAVGAEEIKERGAVRIAEIPVPNVAFVGPDNNAIPNFSIRGIQSQNRANVGYDSGIGVYVDGVFMGRGAAFNQETFDIDRVEFLRGPQGTLFGKNSIAGAISITTRQPGDKFEGVGSIDLGSDNLRRTSAYVSSPLGNDSLRGSLSGYYGKRDGYQNNLATGTKLGTEDTKALRGKLVFTPDARLKITLAGDYLDDNSVASAPSIVSGYGYVPTAGKYDANVDLPTLAERQVKGTSATVNYDLGANLALTSITSYRKLSTNRSSDTDVGPLPIVASFNTSAQDQWSQELRVATTQPGTLEYVGGVYYYHQKVSGSSISTFGPSAPVLSSIRGTTGNTFGDIVTNSYAVFGNADWNVTREVTLTGGLRYTKEEKSLAYQQVVTFPSFLASSLPLQDDSFSTNNFTPLVSARWKITPASMVYATYTKGFRSGGWNVDNITAGGPTSFAQTRFGDESLNSYEIGSKNTLLDGKMTANLTFFRMDYNNIQVTQLVQVLGGGGATVGLVTNGGKARSQGFELELAVRPTQGLRLGAGAGYVDAQYTDYTSSTTGTPISYNGNRLSYAPRLTSNLSASYSLVAGPGYATVRGDYVFTDKYYFGRENTLAQQIPSYELVNARISYGSLDDTWELALYSKNLLDRRYVVASGPAGFAAPIGAGSNQTVQYGRGRSFGVVATYKF